MANVIMGDKYFDPSKATAEEIKHPDGRIDVIVHVPCLQIKAKNIDLNALTTEEKKDLIKKIDSEINKHKGGDVNGIRTL